MIKGIVNKSESGDTKKHSVKAVSPILRGIALLGLTMAAIKLYSQSEETYDIYYMARLGEAIVQEGRIPTENPFSIVPGMSIRVQQPLFCLLCYWVLNNAPRLIPLYGIGMLSVHCLLLYLLAGEYSRKREARLLITTLASVPLALCEAFRPGAFSFILIAWELLVLTRYRKSGRKRLLGLLPLISFLQINIHAALWLFNLIYILPFVFFDCVPNTKERLRLWWESKRPILRMVPLMILAACLNPQGPKALLWLFSTDLSVMRSAVGELYAIPVGFNVFFYIFLLYFAFFVSYTVLCIRKRRVDLGVWYTAAGTLLLAFTFIRNMLFLPLGLCPMMALKFGDGADEKTAEKNAEKNGGAGLIAAFLCAVCLGLFLAGREEIPCKKPDMAIAYLQTNHLEEVHILSEMDAGSYLNYHGFKTMLNNMPEAALKKMNRTEDVFIDAAMAASGREIGSVFEKYDVNCVISCNNPEHFHYPEFKNIRDFCAEQGWIPAVENDEYVMYLKPV